jgi:hypothetical protein
MTYSQFLESKKHTSINYGIDPIFIPDSMFDYQKYVAEYAIKKGRGAVFLDTGLGKTLIELIIAQNYLQHFNKPVLLITPLAVAFQFIREAEKFGITDIEYSQKGTFKSKIVIANYERLHLFNPDNFSCVILDESSILKNFDGALRNTITSFLKKVKYRFWFTATPSPNDFTELGTSSEALGYLGYTDMLTKFFSNNEDTISPQNIGTKWVLKGHAKDNFFKWVSGWSISARKPSDIGFSDDNYRLPNLIVNNHSVANKENLVVNSQIQMFNAIATRLTEVRQENKQTIADRCKKAVELASNHSVSVYWCNLNNEGDLLAKMDKSAVQISGGMSIEKKEAILLDFYNGNIGRLITKPKITAFGLNWQHCSHTTYFPTFSYEQYYQAIRRFWRFGAKKDVTCDLVYSDGQQRVMDSLIAKADKANELFSKLNSSINQSFEIDKKEYETKISIPSFLK